MDHLEASEALADSFAGELGENRAARLREHLSRCADCRSQAEDYRALAAAVASTSEHSSSDQLARRAADPASLTAAERERVDRHLENCPTCRRELELTAEALSLARADRRVGWGSARETTLRALGVRLAIAAGLILALALGFTLRRAPSPDAPSDRVLVAERLAGRSVVHASRTLTATDVTLESGSDIVLRAGDTVVLGSGFSVASEASLQIEIASPDGGR